MTELEKARANRFNEIDFNKLIEEAAAFNEEYFKNAKQIVSGSVKQFIQNKEYLITPGINTMFLLNAILNRIHISDATAPFVIAGLDITRSLYAANLNKKEIETAEAAKKIIELGVTGIKL